MKKLICSLMIAAMAFNTVISVEGRVTKKGTIRPRNGLSRIINRTQRLFRQMTDFRYRDGEVYDIGGTYRLVENGRLRDLRDGEFVRIDSALYIFEDGQLRELIEGETFDFDGVSCIFEDGQWRVLDDEEWLSGRRSELNEEEDDEYTGEPSAKRRRLNDYDEDNYDECFCGYLNERSGNTD